MLLGNHIFDNSSQEAFLYAINDPFSVALDLIKIMNS
tara:strand:+ start:366 stop:476 length:111 start_codon:yes stop_codon:yes gene_type:complete